jgi:hypothetical protein
MVGDNVFETDRLMMALLPVLGPRAALEARHAVLKWAGPGQLAVTDSTLAFADDAGRIVERREGAFGLEAGATIAPPYSSALSDDGGAPAAAVTQRWRLNGWAVAASAGVPESDWSRLVSTCLPLQVPLSTDEHFVLQLVNTGTVPLDLARGVQQAICFVDGTAWRSSAGRIWNGPYLLRPGHASIRRFRLADFPGGPVTGTHEVVLELLGRRSSPQRVRWHGTPFAAAG